MSICLCTRKLLLESFTPEIHLADFSTYSNKSVHQSLYIGIIPCDISPSFDQETVLLMYNVTYRPGCHWQHNNDAQSFTILSLLESCPKHDCVEIVHVEFHFVICTNVFSEDVSLLWTKEILLSLSLRDWHLLFRFFNALNPVLLGKISIHSQLWNIIWFTAVSSQQGCI